MIRSDVEIDVDRKDWIMFSSTCECSSNDHRISVIVENMGENEPLMVSLYYKVGWRDKNRLKDIVFEDGKYLKKIICFLKNRWKDIENIYIRLKMAVKLIFTGHIEMDEEFIFKDKIHLECFLNTLNEAIKQVEKNKV